MQQLQTDDFSYEPSGSTVILAQVVALLGKKDIQAREQAYNMLYVDRWESIKRYLVNRGLNEDRADELCQDTFERMWRQLMRLDKTLPETVSHLNNWLYIIAKSVANDDYRRKKPINCQQLTESDAYIQFDELLVDDKLWIRKELAQMPLKYRVCVVLYYYYGYTQKKIAAIVGISPAAVSMNVSRGIEYLRKKSFPVTADLKRADAVIVAYIPYISDIGGNCYKKIQGQRRGTTYEFKINEIGENEFYKENGIYRPWWVNEYDWEQVEKSVCERLARRPCYPNIYK